MQVLLKMILKVSLKRILKVLLKRIPKVWLKRIPTVLQVKERLEVEEHPVSGSTYFLRQVEHVAILSSSCTLTTQVEGLSNACGTIAMLHAIMNNREVLGIENGESTLGKFYQATKDLNAEERGKALDKSSEIGNVHNGLVSEGQSRQVEGQ